METQGRPDQGGLDARGVGRIADDTVGHAEGIVVHRPRGRHADVPVTHPSRVVLYAGIGACSQHLDRRRPVGETLQEARRQVACAKPRVIHDLPQIVQVRGNAVQARVRQRVCQLVQRGLARIRMHDQLGQHGVVERRHLGAGRDPAVHPQAFRKEHVGQHARRRLELAQRILGIQAHLDGCALRRARHGGVIQRFARGHAQHALHQVQPGDGFRHGMLYLQAGIDLQEIEAVARRVVDEFNGAGGTVVDRLAQPHGGSVQRLARGGGQKRRGRLFDDLLVAALHRAIALAQGQHTAGAVAEDLHLDMARIVDVALDEGAAVAEEVLAHALYAIEGRSQLGLVVAARKADAAASRRAL